MQMRLQTGASLIEVLIAMTLVAVTMLGLLGLQLRSMAAQKDSIDRRSAAVLVAGFAERVSANFVGFETRQYDGLALNIGGAAPAVAACAGATCTPPEIAARDWAQFATEVQNRLPGGVAFVNTPPDLTRTDVVVGWLDVGRVAANEDPANVTLGQVNQDVACPNTAQFTNLANRRYRCYVAQVYP